MARSRSQFVCQDCGAIYPRWQGHCESCGAWNSIVEETPPAPLPGTGPSQGRGRVLETEGLAGPSRALERLLSGLNEFDHVLGGGLVPGSAVLVAGDPGIGKSTLLLQAAAALSGTGNGALYVSGEEATEQLRMRASRLGLGQAPLRLLAATRIGDILTTIAAAPERRPSLLVIDSIQTMAVDGLDSSPGSVSQVRAAAQALIATAKAHGIAVIMVGHVTKEGQIAGPRVLEHMVDCVLYFEGERGHQFRILRAVKNRFGPTDEIGVFEMSDRGLEEVDNPSAIFLGGSAEDGIAPVPGSAVFAGIEGTRPILVEIQALVAPSSLSSPRRAVVGWDSARLAMVIAVLDARCGLALSGQDVYLSVAGGLRISEPAADLAVAAALVSSLAETPVGEKTLFFGEVRLSGEIRSVSGQEARLKEARKLGFAHAVIPNATGKTAGRDSGKTKGLVRNGAEKGLTLIPMNRIEALMSMFGLDPRPQQRSRQHPGQTPGPVQGGETGVASAARRRPPP